MVVMGRVTAPFGVMGWIKIYALTAQPGNLCNYPAWWLGNAGDWREMRVATAKVHGNMLIAQLAGVADRAAAIALKGWEVAVPREQLPDAADDEFYWSDLIGLKVVNTEQHDFGRVARIVQTGANDVLVVAGGGKNEPETLIPFIASAIKRVDLAAGVISVDWGRDY
jgi:16S rRNA processing protein RimM